MREPFTQFIEARLEPGFLLIACGLPGTWKTETTEEVARIKGACLLRTDLIRLEVLKNEDVFDEKVAGNMDKRTQVYDEMFRQADAALDDHSDVILDATFVTQALRRRAAEVAASKGKTFVIQQTQCTQEFSLNKISKRNKENYESNALSDQAYFNNLKKFEDVDLDALKEEFPSLEIVHLLVDTNSDFEEDWYVIGRDDR